MVKYIVILGKIYSQDMIKRKRLIMGFIPFLIIMAIILKSKKDRRRSDISKVIIPIVVIFGLVAILSNPIAVIAILGIASFLIVKGILKITQGNVEWDKDAWEKTVNEQKKNVNPYSKTTNTVRDRQQTPQQSQTASQRTGSYGQAQTGQAQSAQTQSRQVPPPQAKPIPNGKLPKAPAKRKKIISTFNDKYNLCLTEEQIQSITNSSYMSEIWHNEVEAMNQKYNSVYEWFPGHTQWLRAYMYVFHIQDITSDIRQQEKIVVKTFEEIFQYADSLTGFSVPEKIEKINSKYMTSFDDATFMIAYRFLEARGLHHDLEGPELLKDESEIDELLEKYRSVPLEGE